jgi:hypothetical protein
MRRERNRKLHNPLAQSPPQVQQSSSNKLDRYILLLRRNDSSHLALKKDHNVPPAKGKKEKSNIYLLYIFHKDGQLDVKQYFDLKELKSIDFGAEETELVLSFDTSSLIDLNLYLPSPLERDEMVFVLVELCRYVLNIFSQITVGFSIDVDNLRYNNLDINTAVMNKFPLFAKLLRTFGYNLSKGGQQPVTGTAV